MSGLQEPTDSQPNMAGSPRVSWRIRTLHRTNTQVSGTPQVIRQLFLGTATYSWGSQAPGRAIEADAKLDNQMPSSLLSHTHFPTRSAVSQKCRIPDLWCQA